MKKLRRLRLFFVDTYGGKSISYVQESLLQRLDDYERVVREWGFETRTQILSTLLTSKWLAGAAGGSALSILLGEPLGAILATSSAVAVEIGRVTLETTKRQHGFRTMINDNPISYLADLRAAVPTIPK